MTNWINRWEARLDVLNSAHRLRTRRLHTSVAPICFCDNDYLGLAHHPSLSDAWYQVGAEIPVGSAASPLVSGHYPTHQTLEERIAAWLGRDRALLFSSGFAANLGLAQTLLTPKTSVVQDRYNHASLIDGARLMRAPLTRYAHCDLASLEARLRSLSGPGVVWTDSVFSMDGTVAPLQQIAALCARYDALLAVDEAHGFGVMGPTGAGAVEAAGLSQDLVPVVMGTLGKAVGCQGAFVAGPSALIELLENDARTLIYSTAESPRMSAVTVAAIALMQAHPEWRLQLEDNVQYFRARACAEGIPLTDSKTAIQPIILGADARALAASQVLWTEGYWVSAIRPPTVPEGSARLRITLSARHRFDQIDGLIAALAKALEVASR
ncbi:MAG: 8-amino-7-oxononanoate synthase [Litorivicinaceae bacterium]|jgi:8-amino-7-oxononanoate synthase|nr:8-amino-7-oxononanoate synthase [Litorivicinaceae bacterium]